MDLLKNMNNAIKYIENNLTNEIDLKVVARLAYCSEYHFNRMFSYLGGVSLSEYIRRRRLTLAAFELKNSHVKVIDVAIKYGYNSPDSFTRAFHALTWYNSFRSQTKRPNTKSISTNDLPIIN